MITNHRERANMKKLHEGEFSRELEGTGPATTGGANGGRAFPCFNPGRSGNTPEANVKHT